MKNIFRGRCGCNCFECDILKATLNDDDELRKKLMNKSIDKFNNINDYTQINCLGCS